MTIRIGELNERVRLEREQLDAHGERLGAWELIAERFVRIEYLTSGTEVVQNARLQGVQPAILTVVDEDATRLVDNGCRAVGVTPRIADKVFDIKSVINPSKKGGRLYVDFLAEINGTPGGPNADQES